MRLSNVVQLCCGREVTQVSCAASAVGPLAWQRSLCEWPITVLLLTYVHLSVYTLSIYLHLQGKATALAGMWLCQQG